VPRRAISGFTPIPQARRPHPRGEPGGFPGGAVVGTRQDLAKVFQLHAEGHLPDPAVTTVVRGEHDNRSTDGRYGQIVVGVADAPTSAVRFAYEEPRRRGAALDAGRAWLCAAHAPWPTTHWQSAAGTRWECSGPWATQVRHSKSGGDCERNSFPRHSSIGQIGPNAFEQRPVTLTAAARTGVHDLGPSPGQ
jgi:hypothetical protein